MRSFSRPRSLSATRYFAALDLSSGVSPTNHEMSEPDPANLIATVRALEARQDDVLERLDALNRQIEQVLTETRPGLPRLPSPLEGASMSLVGEGPGVGCAKSWFLHGDCSGPFGGGFIPDGAAVIISSRGNDARIPAGMPSPQPWVEAVRPTPREANVQLNRCPTPAGVVAPSGICDPAGVGQPFLAPS